MKGVAVDKVIDALYGLPLEQFTRARDEAARELRQAGEREDAEQVKALRKPAVSAAAVNRLVREHRREVEAFLKAAASLRDAQFAGQGDLAAARERERQALNRLIQVGGTDVRQSLLAAAVDDEAARELLQGRLVRELEPRGFGTLASHAKPSAAKPTTGRRPSPKPKKPDDRAARAKLREAQAALTAAEAQEQQARRHWTHVQKELERARAVAEKAQHDPTE
jgi:hypothetical protein